MNDIIVEPAETVNMGDWDIIGRCISLVEFLRIGCQVRGMKEARYADRKWPETSLYVDSSLHTTDTNEKIVKKSSENRKTSYGIQFWKLNDGRDKWPKP